jgi:hypothetical protein
LNSTTRSIPSRKMTTCNTETFAYRERRKKFNELLMRGEFDHWIDDPADRKAKGHRDFGDDELDSISFEENPPTPPVNAPSLWRWQRYN